MRNEIIRKSFHCFGCIAAIVAAELPVWAVIVVSLCVLSAYLISEAARVRGRSFAPVTTITNLCSRPQEADNPAFGPVALTFGFVCCFIIFAPPIARAAIILSCVADSAAGILGMSFGRHRMLHSPRKTLEGSAGGFICSLPFGFLCVGLSRGAIAAATAAIIESFPLGDFDNLLIPIGTGCVLTLLGG